MVDYNTAYSYTVNWQDGWELQYIAGKIYSALDTSPAEGLFNGSMDFGMGDVTLYFSRELTPAEKVLVDGVMAQSDVGAFPDLTNKVVIEFPDLLNDWKGLQDALNIDIEFAAINPYNGHIFLVMETIPNNTKKNALFNKFRTLVTITRNGTPV